MCGFDDEDTDRAGFGRRAAGGGALPGKGFDNERETFVWAAGLEGTLGGSKGFFKRNIRKKELALK